MKDTVGKIVKYVKETRAETRKVVWPERRYVAVATTIIVILSFITGLYIMVVDFGFTKIFGFLLR